MKNDFQNQFGQLLGRRGPAARNDVQRRASSGVKNPIFAKSLKSTLNPEQETRHEEVVHDRTLYRYWAKVDLAMELLNNEVGFTDEQRQRLVRLLKEETKPPRKMGENDYYVVLYQLSRIPEAKLKPVFDDFQWPFVKRQLDQGRGMGMFLKQNGFVADEGPEPKVNNTPAAGRDARRPPTRSRDHLCEHARERGQTKSRVHLRLLLVQQARLPGIVQCHLENSDQGTWA